MILTCDKCGKTYTFPDKSIKGAFFSGASHSLMPLGQREGCTGILHPDKSESAELDFRATLRDVQK